MLASILNARREAGSAWPEVDEALLLYLEGLYPGRTMKRDETVEDHLRYAGAVEVVEDMRFHFERQRREGVEGDDI